MIRIDATDAIKNGFGKFKGKGSGKDARTIISKTLNTTMTYGRKELMSEVKSKYNVSSHITNRDTRLKRSTPRWNETVLNVNSKPLSLALFDPKQSAKGISVEVKTGSRNVIRGSFFGKMPSGVEGIFAKGKYSGQGFKFRDKRIKKSGNDLNINRLNSIPYSKMYQSVTPEVYNILIANRLDKTLQRNLRKFFKNR